jgi:hypothetical protein
MTPPAIHHDAWGDALIDALREIQGRNEAPIAAVFLDTLGAAFGGRSQDDAAQMTIATDNMQAVAERFKCAFVALHHSGKDEARGMRGSQVLKDRADTVITLGKGRGDIITATVEKQRNAATGQPLTFRLAPATLWTSSFQTCVVADLSASIAGATTTPRSEPKPAKLSPDQAVVLDVIRQAKEPIEVRKWSDLMKGPLLAAKDRDKDALKQAISYSKKSLLSAGYIEIDSQNSTVRIRQNS